MAQLYPHVYNKDPDPHLFPHYYKWELLEMYSSIIRKEDDTEDITDDNKETT